MTMQLDPSQQKAVDLATDPAVRIAVITGGPGCHRKDQKIIRADGTLVAVEDVRVGDKLAGYDGAIRSVLALRTGFGDMARIVPVRGDAFVVNMDHILTIVRSGTDVVTDVSVREFLALPKKTRERSKLFRQPRRVQGERVCTGFTVEPLEAPEAFYGFALDGDGRYLLDDFTVTHNTGKTTTTRAVLDIFDAQGITYELAAPTGKAARRMAEATGRKAKTIHRLLGFSPQGGWEYDEHNPLEADVVLIDEASMVDLELGEFLLAAINPMRTRVIFVGDADQLPPVGPGEPFASLIKAGNVPVARLTTLHRAAEESWVCANAHEVNSGRMPALERRPDFEWVEVKDSADIVPTVLDLIGPGCRYAEGSQVLSPQHNGAAGVQALNTAIQRVINPGKQGEPFIKRRARKGSDKENPGVLRAGDRVIQGRNDYKLHVMNGEIGTIDRIAKEGPVVSFEGRRVPIAYTFEQASALDLAYALTVHRTQGSEFGWAVVVCHSTHTRMLTRKLLYTGITRAKTGVVLVGDMKGLRYATDDRRPEMRLTYLAQRIQGAA